MNDETLDKALAGINARADNENEEKALIEVLASRISELLDSNPDLLFSTLYRLDVSERKINEVLDDKAFEAPLGLAHLIIDRQREKLLTRERFRNQGSADWSDDLD